MSTFRGHLFIVDGKHFRSSKPNLTGCEVRGFVGKGADYELFRESPGNEADDQIGLRRRVSVKNAPVFYTVPKAYFASPVNQIDTRRPAGCGVISGV